MDRAGLSAAPPPRLAAGCARSRAQPSASGLALGPGLPLELGARAQGGPREPTKGLLDPDFFPAARILSLSVSSPRTRVRALSAPAMGRRRRLCLQPYFVWLGCVAIWAQGTAGQPQPPPPKPPRPQPPPQQVRPAAAGSEGGFAVPEYREEGAAAASRVRRRGQQDVLRG